MSIPSTPTVIDLTENGALAAAGQISSFSPLDWEKILGIDAASRFNNTRVEEAFVDQCEALEVTADGRDSDGARVGPVVHRAFARIKGAREGLLYALQDGTLAPTQTYSVESRHRNQSTPRTTTIPVKRPQDIARHARFSGVVGLENVTFQKGDVMPDGNCYFRAFALAEYRDPDRWAEVKIQTTIYLEEVLATYGKDEHPRRRLYTIIDRWMKAKSLQNKGLLARIRGVNAWQAVEITQVLADLYHREIIILWRNEQGRTTLVPRGNHNHRQLFLRYLIVGSHFEAAWPLGESPAEFRCTTHLEKWYEGKTSDNVRQPVPKDYAPSSTVPPGLHPPPQLKAVAEKTIQKLKEASEEDKKRQIQSEGEGQGEGQRESQGEGQGKRVSQRQGQKRSNRQSDDASNKKRKTGKETQA